MRCNSLLQNVAIGSNANIDHYKILFPLRPTLTGFVNKNFDQ